MRSVEEILLQAEEHMEKSLSVLTDQLSGLRTGKASPALVEGLQIPYYGTLTRLRELANVSTPEARLIVISAYDPTALADIEKAILAANLGVTPINDKRVIRVPIPELNEERRKELIKVARRMAEECRVALRNVRREANDHLKRAHKDSDISEDDSDRGLKEVQDLTDVYTGKVASAVAAKERDIMEV